MADVCLTTVDNPFSPFSQWENWFDFDVSKGYNTCSLLARIARSSDELSDAEEEQIVEDAIDEIVAINALGLYKKVKRGDYPADGIKTSKDGPPSEKKST